MGMTPDVAAREWWETKDEVDAAGPALKRHEAAARVIKDHMRALGLDTFKGIDRKVGHGGKRLDEKAARAELGDALDPFYRDLDRVSLVGRRRPRFRRRPSAGSSPEAG